MLCVLVLPYSNWQWATVCLSESLAALRKGVQRALFRLGRAPKYHQTDNSTAATRRIAKDDQASSTLARNDPGVLARNDPVLMRGRGRPRTGDGRRRRAEEASVLEVPPMVHARPPGRRSAARL
jgi:hypothetical protein